jgi:hypothetical protein
MQCKEAIKRNIYNVLLRLIFTTERVNSESANWVSRRAVYIPACPVAAASHANGLFDLWQSWSMHGNYLFFYAYGHYSHCAPIPLE